MISPGMAQWKLAFQISPIYLAGGIGSNLAGGMLPFISLSEAGNFSSLLSGGGDLELDDYFAHFQPLPGTSLITNELGTYPFANQQTAANALITQPLQVSMMMICPAKNPGDMFNKMAIWSSIKATLDQHIISGGTFTVATPSYLFTDCILVGLRDISSGESHQPQFRWQWDFRKPLISLQDAQQAQNNLLGRISNGSQVTPNGSDQISWTDPGNTIGNPSSGVAGQVIPPNQQDPALSSGALGNGFSRVADIHTDDTAVFQAPVTATSQPVLGDANIF